MANFFTGGGARLTERLTPVTDFFFEVAKGTISGHSIVNKYGNNPDIDTGTDPEDIWTYGGKYTYNDTPSIQYISSDDATDLGMEITVEGLDENWREQSVTVQLDGQNQTQIGTGERFVRVFRAYNSGPLEFAGNVLIYDDTVASVTLGVPSPATSVKAELPAAYQQTYMALYTVPAGKVGYIIEKAWSLNDASTSTRAIVELKTRNFGGVFRSKELDSLRSNGTSLTEVRHLAPDAIPEKSDIQMICKETSNSNTNLTAYFSVLLVQK